MTAWKKVEQGAGWLAHVPCENNLTISDNTNHYHCQLATSEADAGLQKYLMDAIVV